MSKSCGGLKSNCKADGGKHCLVMPDDVIMDTGPELQLGKFRLDVREKIISVGGQCCSDC